MPGKSYSFGYDQYGNTSTINVKVNSHDLLGNNYTYRGTAFTDEERKKLKIEASLPPRVKPLELQVKSCLHIIENKQNDIEKFIYIRSLFDRNVTLAHAVIASDITKFLSIIYTPTVGLACQEYSSMFRKANGLHFYPENIHEAEEVLSRFKERDIRVAVVTDNQGILGIGDQGAGGIAICLGKLMLYTQGAGIAPWHCLPISLDVGTDNELLLNDTNYLGWRHKRIRGDEYLDFVRKFAAAFKKVFPNSLCQWEDFSKQNAFTVRDEFVKDLVSFNDDVQGTGSVALAGIIAAMKIKGENLADQVFLVHGAGAGGVGIAEQIETELVEKGMSTKDAKGLIFTLDSRGVVTTDRKIEPYKEKFAKDPKALSWMKSPEDNNLLNAVINEKVTVLIGTSGQPGCFTKDVVEAVLANTKRPVILPLSNPTSKAEALPEDIFKWTDGKALVATGSPFEPVSHGGKEIRIGQMNNAFIFPGVGLGTIASGASEVLPTFFTAAAHAVAEYVDKEDLEMGILFPPLETLRDVSRLVAKNVCAAAVKGGVSRECSFSEFNHETDAERMNELVDKMCWNPVYLPIIPE